MGYKGTSMVPHCLDWGYRSPTFLDTGEEFAVIRGDLRRLNQTKTVFGGALSRTQPGKLTYRLGIQRCCATFSTPELVPPLIRTKLHPNPQPRLLAGNKNYLLRRLKHNYQLTAVSLFISLISTAFCAAFLFHWQPIFSFWRFQLQFITHYDKL